MKTLEEIEKMSQEELELAASESTVPVPDGLQDRIRQNLAAAEVSALPGARRIRLPWTVIGVAAAAAITLVALLPHSTGPKDTFDDPRMAYAEVEKAFQLISDKMSAGVEIAREAQSATEIPQNILDKIHSK